MKRPLHSARSTFIVALLAGVLAACSSTPTYDEKDSAEKLYADARADMSAGS